VEQHQARRMTSTIQRGGNQRGDEVGGASPPSSCPRRRGSGRPGQAAGITGSRATARYHRGVGPGPRPVSNGTATRRLPRRRRHHGRWGGDRATDAEHRRTAGPAPRARRPPPASSSAAAQREGHLSMSAAHHRRVSAVPWPVPKLRRQIREARKRGASRTADAQPPGHSVTIHSRPGGGPQPP